MPDLIVELSESDYRELAKYAREMGVTVDEAASRFRAAGSSRGVKKNPGWAAKAIAFFRGKKT